MDTKDSRDTFLGKSPTREIREENPNRCPDCPKCPTPGERGGATFPEAREATGGAVMTERPFQLSNRIALTVQEAADTIGVSERHLRSMLLEIPHTRMGNRVVIPVENLKKWLSERADTELRNVDQAYQDTMRELNSE